DPVSLRTLREAPDGVLNLCWVPIRVDTRIMPNQAVLRHTIAPEWKMRGGVDVWYEPELLRRRNRSEFPEQDQHQYRAAATTALAVLVYVLLQLVTERCARARGRRPTTLMLRFQTQGKGTPDTEGDPRVYAVAQAVESALLRDAPVRMQGIVVQGTDLQWKERGTVAALASALPLLVSAPESIALTKVATIVYSTRPCDEHPQIAAAEGHVFRAKTYLSEPVNEPFRGYRFSLDRMQTHVVRGHDELRTPKLIVEEVARLREQGYEHFILQSSYFGGRRLNASAERHSVLTQRAFLEEVAAKFADVSTYLVRRDVFPATRLRKRDSNESAFEVSRLAEHQQLLAQDSDLLKQLVPIFTFATLSIVGNDDVARPQSGFCTYFLDTDYQVRNPEWRERVRSNILRDSPLRQSLLFALRAIHFLEAEKLPTAEIFQPILDPYSWTAPPSRAVAGEIDAIPASRRRAAVVLSLPALLSRVSDALHRG
ncbi:MAG TPA: hypothetical protein VI653_17465, partial [Steroidobacteraceae bacterium]